MASVLVISKNTFLDLDAGLELDLAEMRPRAFTDSAVYELSEEDRCDDDDDVACVDLCDLDDESCASTSVGTPGTPRSCLSTFGSWADCSDDEIAASAASGPPGNFWPAPTVVVGQQRTLESVEDSPTTVLVKNLPNDIDRAGLIELLNQKGLRTQFDFLYVPKVFGTGANLGYFLINLVSNEAASQFWDMFQGFCDWDTARSSKACEVLWASSLHGLAACVDKYRNSAIMHNDVPDEYRPVLLDNGVRMQFPQPTKTVRAPRMKGSGKRGSQVDKC